MKLIVILCFSFISSINVWSQELKTYNFESYSIKIPSGWIKETIDENNTLFYPLEFAEGIKKYAFCVSKITNITTKEDDLEPYLSLTRSSISQFQQGEITSEEKMSINDIESDLITYQIQTFTEDKKASLYIIRQDEIAFQLTAKGDFEEYQKYDVTSKIIAYSFKLK